MDWLQVGMEVRVTGKDGFVDAGVRGEGAIEELVRPFARLGDKRPTAARIGGKWVQLGNATVETL